MSIDREVGAPPHLKKGNHVHLTLDGDLMNGEGRRLAKLDADAEMYAARLEVVTAYTKQLQAQISEASSTDGLSVAVTHSTFESRLPVAA